MFPVESGRRPLHPAEAARVRHARLEHRGDPRARDRCGSTRASALLAFLGYTRAMAVAYTWPLAIRLNGVPHDLGDPLLTTWFLWWSGRRRLPLTAALVERSGLLSRAGHLRLFGAPPRARANRRSAERADRSAAHRPQRRVHRDVRPERARRALPRLHAHPASRRRRSWPAVAFAFAPYRLPQTPHIQVLASFWTPVCLAALHRYDADLAARWALAAAAAWVLQALSCGYYLFFLAVLVAFWMLWFAVGRWPVRQLLRGRGRLRRRRAAAGAHSPRLSGHPPGNVRVQPRDRRDPRLQRRHRVAALGERGSARLGMGARLRAPRGRTFSGAHDRAAHGAWRSGARERRGSGAGRLAADAAHPPDPRRPARPAARRQRAADRCTARGS